MEIRRRLKIKYLKLYPLNVNAVSITPVVVRRACSMSWTVGT